jgi:hypothetical protein
MDKQLLFDFMHEQNDFVPAMLNNDYVINKQVAERSLKQLHKINDYMKPEALTEEECQELNKNDDCFVMPKPEEIQTLSEHVALDGAIANIHNHKFEQSHRPKQ